MPENSAWVFGGPEAWRKHQEEVEAERQRVRQAKTEAARLGRAAGVYLDWRLLAGTAYDRT